MKFLLFDGNVVVFVNNMISICIFWLFCYFLLTSIHFPLSVRAVLRVMYAFGNTILVGNTIRAYIPPGPGRP